jgi:hypothetical protein
MARLEFYITIDFAATGFGLAEYHELLKNGFKWVANLV